MVSFPKSLPIHQTLHLVLTFDFFSVFVLKITIINYDNFNVFIAIFVV